MEMSANGGETPAAGAGSADAAPAADASKANNGDVKRKVQNVLFIFWVFFVIHTLILLVGPFLLVITTHILGAADFRSRIP